MPGKPLDNYLRMGRREKRLTQEELALLLGMDDGGNVSRYERGRRTPSLDLALAYEAIVGIPVSELFAGRFLSVELEVEARAKLLAERLGEAAPSLVRALSEEKTCGETETERLG
jgi:transcriptional regulator with XRE-family HTH domain